MNEKKPLFAKTKDFILKNKFLLLAVIYIIWPLDIIPDIFGALGGPVVMLDDGGILLFAVLQKIYSSWRDRQKPQDN